MSTENLRKRFVKDFSLPINIFSDPYFDYYLALYQNAFQSQSRYNDFLAFVERCGGEEEYFQESAKLRERILSEVKALPAYDNFLKMDMSIYNKHALGSKNKCSLYHPSNDGGYFISVDLVTANMQALSYVNPSLVFHAESWAEFLANFTDETYWARSKQVRQVVFGNLNPKRQQTVQCFLVGKIHFYLETTGWRGKFLPEVASATSDEIIYQFQDRKVAENAMEELSNIMQYFAFNTHLDFFTLHQLEGHSMFCKEFHAGEHAGTKRLKSVPTNYYAQAYRHINGQEPTEYDMLGYFEGRLYRMLDPLF